MAQTIERQAFAYRSQVRSQVVAWLPEAT